MRKLISSILLTIAAYILFINICIWLDVMQIGDMTDDFGHSYWYANYYYFGVSSFTNWLHDMPLSISNYNALGSVIRLGQSLSGITLVDAGVDYIQFLIALLIGPVSFIWQIILEIIQLSNQVVLPLFQHIAKLLVGMYNLPIGAYPEIYYPSISITPVIL